jgi:Fe-S-cluster containining protein
VRRLLQGADARLPLNAHLYSCDQLGEDGLCTAHETRPLVCRGYPWYGAPVRDMPLADPRCGYAHDQVQAFVIQREDF